MTFRNYLKEGFSKKEKDTITKACMEVWNEIQGDFMMLNQEMGITNPKEMAIGAAQMCVERALDKKLIPKNVEKKVTKNFEEVEKFLAKELEYYF